MGPAACCAALCLGCSSSDCPCALQQTAAFAPACCRFGCSFHAFSCLTPLFLWQARWAHRRAGFLLAAAEKYEEGVTAFQSALKTDVRDAGELG